MSDMISKAKFEKHMKQLTQIPEGFTVSQETEQRGWRDHPMPVLVYVVKSETIEIRFDQTGSGHTLFVNGDSKSTFDRLGVEDSFYHLPLWEGDPEPYDLNAILKEQVQRVAQYFEYKKTALTVPGIPFSIAPDSLAGYQQRLKTKGTISFMPSGFGTGYQISRAMRRGAKRASTAMEKFFGVAPLFISTFDAD